MIIVVTAASVITAGVPFAVVMVSTEKSFARNEGSCQICSDCIFNRAFGSANDLDAILRQCIDRAAANASADQHVNLFAGKQSGKRTMSGISARNDTGRNNLSILAVADNELRSVSEMLKDESIFTSNGNSHVVSFFFVDSVRI
jgi:hypothetical protein